MSQPQSPWMVDVSSKFTAKQETRAHQTLGPPSPGPLGNPAQPHWSALSLPVCVLSDSPCPSSSDQVLFPFLEPSSTTWATTRPPELSGQKLPESQAARLVQHRVAETGSGVQEAWATTPALPLRSCVSLSKSLPLPEPQRPPVQWGWWCFLTHRGCEADLALALHGACWHPKLPPTSRSSVHI